MPGSRCQEIWCLVRTYLFLEVAFSLGPHMEEGARNSAGSPLKGTNIIHESSALMI